MTERAKDCAGCDPAIPIEHRWSTNGLWGVILGISWCLDCGRVCRKEDFPWIYRTSDYQSREVERG